MLQVTAAAFKQIQAQLAKAPYGYQGDARVATMQDWRSWKAVLDEKWSLAAVLLHQRFPDQLMCANRTLLPHVG